VRPSPGADVGGAAQPRRGCRCGGGTACRRRRRASPKRAPCTPRARSLPCTSCRAGSRQRQHTKRTRARPPRLRWSASEHRTIRWGVQRRGARGVLPGEQGTRADAINSIDGRTPSAALDYPQGYSEYSTHFWSGGHSKGLAIPDRPRVRRL
jgi:hypothetical protein